MNGVDGAAAMGMNPAQWLKARPEITRENEIALAVWSFCGGWNPERVPMAAAYFGVADVDFLIDQLLAMRAVIDKRAS